MLLSKGYMDSKRRAWELNPGGLLVSWWHNPFSTMPANDSHSFSPVWVSLLFGTWSIRLLWAALGSGPPVCLWPLSCSGVRLPWPLPPPGLWLGSSGFGSGLLGGEAPLWPLSSLRGPLSTGWRSLQLSLKWRWSAGFLLLSPGGFLFGALQPMWLWDSESSSELGLGFVGSAGAQLRPESQFSWFSLWSLGMDPLAPFSTRPRLDSWLNFRGFFGRVSRSSSLTISVFFGTIDGFCQRGSSMPGWTLGPTSGNEAGVSPWLRLKCPLPSPGLCHLGFWPLVRPWPLWSASFSPTFPLPLTFPFPLLPPPLPLPDLPLPLLPSSPWNKWWRSEGFVQFSCPGGLPPSWLP